MSWLSSFLLPAGTEVSWVCSGSPQHSVVNSLHWGGRAGASVVPQHYSESEPSSLGCKHLLGPLYNKRREDVSSEMCWISCGFTLFSLQHYQSSFVTHLQIPEQPLLEHSWWRGCSEGHWAGWAGGGEGFQQRLGPPVSALRLQHKPLCIRHCIRIPNII